MKYIKLFEDFNSYKFKVGQDVVALSSTKDNSRNTIKRIKGVIYNIKDIHFCNKCGKQYLNFGERASEMDGFCTSCEAPQKSGGKCWAPAINYAPLDEKTLEKMLEDALNDEDYLLAATLRDLLKTFKKEEKEEVITIEDWKKY